MVFYIIVKSEPLSFELRHTPALLHNYPIKKNIPDRHTKKRRTRKMLRRASQNRELKLVSWDGPAVLTGRRKNK
jgi:hypothetical protein